MSFFDRFRRKQDKERLAASRMPAAQPVQAKPKADVKAEKVRAATPGSVAKEKKTERKGQVSAASYQTLIRPLVTEKSVRLGNAYAFAVRPDANKRQITEAIRALYGVTPVGVRVQNYLGKHVRYGRYFGRTKQWKKAIVTVKAGESIQLNENV